jgi:hypothetical protein
VDTVPKDARRLNAIHRHCRLHSEWPRDRRAAEKRDELASFHSITSSARASTVGGTKEFARLTVVAKSLRGSRQYRKLAEMYWALALGEESNRARPSKTNVK